MKALKGHISMLGANVIWGLMSPVAKIVMGAGLVMPLLMTGFRVAGAALLFWLTSLFCPREHVPLTDLLLLAGAGMLGVLFNQGCFIFGVGYTSPGEASIITTTMPMWVMLLAAVFLREPITAKKVGGIILGASGAIILVYSGLKTSTRGSDPLLGDILVLCAQLSYATYLTLYKNFIKKYSLVTLMKWMFTFATIVLAPFAFTTVRATDFGAFTSLEWLGVGYVVVFGTFIAYIFIMIGQKTLRPTVVGMYNYFQPIVAMCVGLWLGLDRFSPLKGLAIALIFTGLWLVNISKARGR